MAIRVVTKQLAGLEDIVTGEGTVSQTRDGVSYNITKIGASVIPYDNTGVGGAGGSIKSRIDTLDTNVATNAANIATNVTNIALAKPGGTNGNILTISGSGNNRDSGVAIGVAANNALQLDGSAKVPFANKAGLLGALAYTTATSPIATATNHTVAWNNELYDTAGMHDNAVNNSRLTVPAGVQSVRLTAQIMWQSNATGIRWAVIMKNGTPTYNGSTKLYRNAVNGSVTTLLLTSPILTVSPGDYFEVRVHQTSGGNLNLEGGADDAWFAMEAID
jgi:hypothetical protein